MAFATHHKAMRNFIPNKLRYAMRSVRLHTYFIKDITPVVMLLN